MSERWKVSNANALQAWCVYEIGKRPFIQCDDESQANQVAAALNAAEQAAKERELLAEAVDIANNAWEHVTYSTVAREMKDPPRLKLSIEHGKETGRRIRKLLAEYAALQTEGE